MLVYLQMIETPLEKSKFEQLYHQYRALMFHVANGILHNDRDAEDAVHNAFVSIAENISKIEDPNCPKTKGYIVTIVERKAIDLYRRKQRRNVISIDEVNLGIQPEPDSGVALAGCFGKLSDRYRHALMLKFRYGYETREIAKLMGISAANAAKLIQRAKQQLEKLCEEEGIL